MATLAAALVTAAFLFPNQKVKYLPDQKESAMLLIHPSKPTMLREISHQLNTAIFLEIHMVYLEHHPERESTFWGKEWNIFVRIMFFSLKNCCLKLFRGLTASKS